MKINEHGRLSEVDIYFASGVAPCKHETLCLASDPVQFISYVLLNLPE